LSAASDAVDGKRLVDDPSVVVRRRGHVDPGAGEQDDEGRRREPGLHHRALVGERYGDRAGRRPNERAVRDSGHGDRRRCAVHPGEGVQDLGGRARPRDGEHRVVGAAGGDLRGGKGVGLAVPARLPGRGVRLGDVERRAAADGGDAGTGGRKEAVRVERGRLEPDTGLARDLLLDCAHIGRLYAETAQIATPSCTFGR
jgi:hypothetical protein